MARFFGVASDDDYTATHKRERLTVWSGPFMSNYEAEAFTLPKGDGYMVTTYTGVKVRVECPTPRTDATYQAVDDAISGSLVALYGEGPPVNILGPGGFYYPPCRLCGAPETGTHHAEEHG